MIIAVDGPAASGKGTVSRRLAAHYGLRYLDTGVLYRAVGAAVIAAGGDLDDAADAVAAAEALDLDAIDAAALRGPGAGEAASRVARHPEVRAQLIDIQRAFARRAPGAILDGRDIGTVVCPDADVKLYVEATPEVRADRRYRELANQDAAPDYETVLDDIRLRDERDMSRPVAPLRRADDAHLLDTTDLDIEAAFREAVSLIDSACST